jgi:plasmid stabilization system protein ParE
MSMQNSRLVVEALAEHERQYDNLFLHSVTKADGYRREILAGLLAIQKKPNGYGFVAGTTYRSYGPTKKEKYRIAYLEADNEIVVVAIYYSGLADPLYWLDRLFF